MNTRTATVVSQPLTLVAKLQPSPVFVVERKPDQAADSPVRTALARGNTITERAWRNDSVGMSDSDGEQAGSGSGSGSGEVESSRPKSSRRVSFVGLSQSSSIGSDIVDITGQHDVEMTSSPSSSKRGFGLSEEDLLSSRESSPAEPTFAPGPLSELDELQLETTAGEDAAVETASVELMAIGSSGSHSPMDLDSDVARSPPASDVGAKLAKLVSAGLPSPVSPELHLVAISPADEEPTQVDGDEHDMPRSTNPSQSKVGRTLVYSRELDSSGETVSTRAHPASSAPGPLEPVSRAGFAEPSSPAQLSPALFPNVDEDTHSASGNSAWAGGVDEQDDDEDLLSQAASQLPSPSRSPEGFGSTTSDVDAGFEGSVEPLESEVMSRVSTADSDVVAEQGSHNANSALSTDASGSVAGRRRQLSFLGASLGRARRRREAAADKDDGPEPPVSSSPVSKHVATFLEELDDVEALIRAAERATADLEADSDSDQDEDRAAAAGTKAPGSPVSARIAAHVEELEEQHALVFEAEHTPDDIRVESYSDAAWSDRGEDDAREPMRAPRASAAHLLDDDYEEDDEDDDDEPAQSYEPCHIAPAAIASIARSPNLAALVSTMLASHAINLEYIASDAAREREPAPDAEAQSSDQDLVDLDEGSAGSGEEDGSSEAVDMEDDDDDDEMSEQDVREEEDGEDDAMSEGKVSPAGEVVVASAGPDAMPVEEPIAPPPIRPIGLSLSYRRKQRAAPVVDSDPDLDQGDQDLDQVDLDLDDDAFLEEHEKDYDADEVDHPDGFDDDGAEWEDGVSEKLVAAAAEQAERIYTTGASCLLPFYVVE